LRFLLPIACLFLYDAQQQVIGLAHAGWRGTRDNIAGKAVLAMMKEYDCRPENIYVGFGPGIRSCCYGVGEEFTAIFQHGLIRRNNLLYFDLIKANTEQLLSREIKQANIFDCSICTSCCHDEYFSYRSDGSSGGRAMAVLMMH